MYAGAGLSGGGLSGDVTLSVVTSTIQQRVTGSCGSGNAIRVVNADGSVTCQDITQSITATYAANADTLDGQHGAYYQRLVTGTCSAGSAIRVVSADGSVTCQDITQSITATYATNADTVDGQHASGFWNTTGNSGTNPATNFLGTTDGVSLTLRVSNTVALRLAPGAGSGTPNVIGGYAGNVISDTVVGGVIAGGGAAGTVNRVTANYATVGGGYYNQATGWAAAVVGGANNQATNDYATVGGGYGNRAANIGAFVGGGGIDGPRLSGNEARGAASTIGGGVSNLVTATYGTIAGGYDITVIGQYATVGGGYQNQASGAGAFVGGGGWDEFVPGGSEARGVDSTIGGGYSNLVTNTYGTIAGGYNITVTGPYATVGGGYNNQATGSRAMVGGGAFNTASGDSAFVGAGYSNLVMAAYGTIAGGLDITVTGQYGTVGGGRNNVASGAGAFVGGGGWNDTPTPSGNVASGTASTIGGGFSNVVTSTYGTIAGGYDITVTGQYGTVGGGYGNLATAIAAAIGGGFSNRASGGAAAIGGGESNQATKSYTTVGGGYNNQTTEFASSIGGGYSNTASGQYSTVPGGYKAQATHYGEVAYASGAFANAGDAQGSLYVLRATTVDTATWHNLYLDGSTASLTVAVSRTVTFDILVVGRSNAGNSAGYHIQGVIENVGGTTALVGATTFTPLGEDDGACDAQVVAGSGALLVQVKGNNETIRWVATVHTAEVSW